MALRQKRVVKLDEIEEEVNKEEEEETHLEKNIEQRTSLTSLVSPKLSSKVVRIRSGKVEEIG